MNLNGAVEARPDPGGFATSLVFMRQARGWSQADLARRMRLSQQSVAKLENPERANPTLRTIAKLGRVFGCDVRLLFCPPVRSLSPQADK